MGRKPTNVGKPNRTKDGQPTNLGAPRRIEISREQVIRCCQSQCTLEEVAGFFDVSIETVEQRVKEWDGCSYPEFFDRHSASGKGSVRRAQFVAALKGNVQAQIWYGKQYLGQRDFHRLEAVGGKPGDAPIKIEVSSNARSLGEKELQAHALQVAKRMLDAPDGTDTQG